MTLLEITVGDRMALGWENNDTLRNYSQGQNGIRLGKQ